jgi:chromosomal replication initiator protein
LSVAANPNKNTFNPLFIYGGSGLGKTHISHAIGWEVMKRHPEKVVLYVDANRFQQQYSDAHLSNKVNDFLNFYQQIDVLIVDDIQFFSNKVGTQNVFFQIFNHLQQIGKQIILTSDCSPKHLQGLDERILSRFRWGLTVELTSPNQDTREAILQYKVNKGGLQIPETVVRYIAENVQDNIRELEGVLISLLAQSTFTQDEINISLAEKVVSRIVNVADRVVSIQSIQKMVCDYYRLDTKDIQTKSRRREVVQARQIAMYLSRKYTKNSLSTIGEQIGNRDHATVLYACKAVTDLLKYDKSFRQSVENIESALI